LRDKRYDLLFEPVEIGPVTAKNRFYQVPHCTGLGRLRPRMLAALRGMKAEGGWGVVCTEWCSIHPTSDDLPHPNASLWNDDDIKDHALMTEAVHRHDALAGVELWIGGNRAANLYTREVSLDVASTPNLAGHPYQSRAMDKSDIEMPRCVPRRRTSMWCMYTPHTGTCCPIFSQPIPTPAVTSTAGRWRIERAYCAN